LFPRKRSKRSIYSKNFQRKGLSVKSKRHVHKLFEDLVQPHLRSLKNTAFRLAKDQLRAEDLLQETLLKAYKNFSQFQLNTNFRAWIFKIMVNTYITSYRKMNKQPQAVSYNDLEEFYLFQKSKDTLMFSEDAPDTIPGDHFEDEVQNALKQLPYYFRMVVLLYDIEGFSYNDIARIINIPVGTVMSRLNRGRSLLRKKLKRYARNKGYVPAENMEMEFTG
jgi:RNA polymerase sigma-70 factor (ECF subfamily)